MELSMSTSCMVDIKNLEKQKPLAYRICRPALQESLFAGWGLFKLLQMYPRTCYNDSDHEQYRDIGKSDDLHA